jgi:hypothetical protein
MKCDAGISLGYNDELCDSFRPPGIVMIVRSRRIMCCAWGVLGILVEKPLGK